MSEVFVAGSWRNERAVVAVLAALDEVGVSAYSFVRASYEGEAARFAVPGGADDADLDEIGMRRLFDDDLAALRAAGRFVLVLPAGAAAHVEAGIAYGWGKRCYAVGPAERMESLYRVFDRMCSTPGELARHLVGPDVEV